MRDRENTAYKGAKFICTYLKQLIWIKISKFNKNCKITVLENEKQRKQKGETNKIEF